MEDDYYKLLEKYNTIKTKLSKKSEKIKSLDKTIDKLNKRIYLLEYNLEFMNEIEAENEKLKKVNKECLDAIDKMMKIKEENLNLKDELSKLGHTPVNYINKQNMLNTSSLINQMYLYIPLIKSNNSQHMISYVIKCLNKFKENTQCSEDIEISNYIRNDLKLLNITSEDEDSKYENLFRNVYKMNDSLLEIDFIKYKGCIQNSFIEMLKNYILMNYKDAESIMKNFEVEERSKVYKLLMLLFHPDKNIRENLLINAMVLSLTGYKDSYL